MGATAPSLCGWGHLDFSDLEIRLLFITGFEKLSQHCVAFDPFHLPFLSFFLEGSLCRNGSSSCSVPLHCFAVRVPLRRQLPMSCPEPDTRGREAQAAHFMACFPGRVTPPQPPHLAHALLFSLKRPCSSSLPQPLFPSAPALPSNCTPSRMLLCSSLPAEQTQ